MSRQIDVAGEKKLGERFLGSQSAFLSFPTPALIDPTKPRKVFMKVICGGWGSGKSYAGIVNGLMLSAMFPGNEGIIGRFHGKDLEDSIIPLFFQICPESWIARIQNRGKTGMTVRLVNGSVIYFRHIHDAGGGATKSRRVGANLGWFFLSQIEEMTEGHWQTLMGRLRNPKAGIKMGMGDANPDGRNWVQRMFFPNWKPLDIENDVFFRSYQKGNILAVHVDSEENREINGGFIQDDYFDNLIANMSPDWVNRYIHGSFEDFSGKVYKGYNFDSIHNIDPIAVPRHWECTVSIDVGGSCPWGVVVAYTDECGNVIVTDTLSKVTSRTAEIAEWIKGHCPWNEARTTFIIDPENKLAAGELSDMGIYCRVAQKAVHQGTLRTASYFHVRKGEELPAWFRGSQGEKAIEKAKAFGVPRVFVTRENIAFRREHDEVVWDDKRPNTIKKTHEKRYDLCFAAGTQVLLADGTTKNIEDVRVGDLVLTRKGPRPVLWSGLTAHDADVMNLRLTDGTLLTATPAHNVWTVGNAWRPLDTLRYGDELLSCDQNPYFIEATNSDYTKTFHIIGNALTARIGKFIITSGFAKKVFFPIRRKWTSITKTGTKTTTIFPTWSVFQNAIINCNTWRILEKRFRWLHRGIGQQKVWHGIVKTANALGIIVTQRFQELATIAKQTSWPSFLLLDFAGITANQLGDETAAWMMFRKPAFSVQLFSQVTNITASSAARFPVRVVSTQLAGKRDVYDICVQGQHEFYANGILVHNCDAFRYLCAIKPDASQLPKNQDPYSELREISLLAAKEMEATDREVEEMTREQEGRGGKEMFNDQDYQAVGGGAGDWRERNRQFDWN